MFAGDVMGTTKDTNHTKGIAVLRASFLSGCKDRLTLIALAKSQHDSFILQSWKVPKVDQQAKSQIGRPQIIEDLRPVIIS